MQLPQRMESFRIQITDVENHHDRNDDDDDDDDDDHHHHHYHHHEVHNDVMQEGGPQIHLLCFNLGNRHCLWAK